MPRQSSSFRQHLAKQREFIFSGLSAGCEAVIREDIFDSVHVVSKVDHIVDLLKNFKRYQSAKAKFGGGAIFCGPAGTGKTMMARYVATQSRARFIDVRQFPVVLKSGVHIWQPHDIQNLFCLCEEWARKNNSPAVLFIDQFDDWIKVHMNVISQLEIELDGFSGRREGVYLIVTAKNEPDDFGGSLFRSGRIENKIAFGLPDRRQQIELITGFLSGYPRNSRIDLNSLVYLLDEPSQADLRSFIDEAYASLLRERSVAEAKRGRKIPLKDVRITEEKLIEVLLSRVLDPETGQTMMKEEERRVAIHEVGHYLVARALGRPARFVSCRPGLENLGLTFAGDNGLDRKNPSVEEDKYAVSVCLAGAESVELLGIRTHVDGTADNRSATELAQSLLATGVDPKSPLAKEYGGYYFADDKLNDEGEIPPISEELRSKTEKAVAVILKKEKLRARKVLRFFGRRLIAKIADTLISKPNKVMLQRELDRLLEPRLSQFRKRYKIVEIK